MKRIALMHNIYLRRRGIESSAPVWLSVIGVAMLAVSGWLGGKMVYVHGVAVETPPHPAAPPKHHLGT